jgi:hypothetical protein
MKTIFTSFACIFIISAVFGQTELIAYKSHSGNMKFFKATNIDNLGGPPIRIDSIIKVNDSTIIEYNSYGWGTNQGGPVYTDTVTNHPICKLPNNKVDSLKTNYYHSDIKFIGFDSTSTKIEEVDSIIEIKDEKKVKRNKRKDKKYEISPISPNNTPNDSGLLKTQSLTVYLFSGLLVFLIGLTSIIWFSNKKKVTIS